MNLTPTERKNLNLVRAANRHMNYFRYWKSRDESEAHERHEQKKYELYREIIKCGHNVLVEPIFVGGGRADIFDISNGVIMEIVVSESKESIEEKRKKYPSGVEIVEVRA